MALKRNALTVIALAASTLLAGAPALAQTVYKLIDKNGKVTYAEEPPKYFDGQVIRIDIDPNANKATLGNPDPTRSGEPAGPKAKKPRRETEQPSSRAERAEEARQKLEDARNALADARDHPAEGDVQFIGNVRGGTRPVPSETYQRRLDALERAVKEAENELHDIEAGR